MPDLLKTIHFSEDNLFQVVLTDHNSIVSKKDYEPNLYLWTFIVDV